MSPFSMVSGTRVRLRVVSTGQTSRHVSRSDDASTSGRNTVRDASTVMLDITLAAISVLVDSMPVKFDYVLKGTV